MPGKLFISQAAIDGLVSSERVELQGEVLTFRDSGQALVLRPASLFRTVAGEGEDRHGLVGRVKDEAAISAMGAEAYMSSVLFDDTAYDVDPGFIATLLSDSAQGRRAVLDSLRAITS